MKAPIPLNLKKPGNEIRINSDPAKLDEVYVRMLGRDGDKMLSDEVKWLAVTHKSFDHGRRGFNDRLAYLGRLRVSFRVWLLVG
jgi:large subunit ribosomal protein L15